MTSDTPDYYEVLDSQPSDSTEQIKKSYQSLLLRHHPDKQEQINGGSDKDNGYFQRIDEAWKVLRDPVQRKTYDAELQQRKFNEKPIVHETLRTEEFDFDTEHQVYVHKCRCGGFFVMPNEYAEENAAIICCDDEIYIECDECSLVVQLIAR